MALHPAHQSFERILAYGPYGSGKSNGWLNIMEWYQRTNASGRFFCIDTDFNWQDIGHMFPNAPIEVAECETLVEMKAAAKKFKAAANPTRGDWLIVDMIDKAWKWAQHEFFEYQSDKDIDIFLMEARKSGESIGGEYGANWGVINTMYNEFIEPVLRFPGHRYACTGADEVRKPDPKKGERANKAADNPEIVEVYGRAGLKPVGQKDLGHQFRSVLLFQDSPNGWRLSTIKDRGRERVTGVKVEQFVTTYMIPVAGWRP